MKEYFYFVECPKCGSNDTVTTNNVTICNNCYFQF